MNRVATLAQHTLMLDSISKTQSRVFERQAQIASGKEARTFDDIARETQRLIGFENQMARAEEFINQNGVIEARIQVMDSTLNGILEVASDLKVRLLQRVDSSTGTAGDLAGEGASMLDTVAGLLNTQINGRFLFAGSATQTAPVPDPVPDPTAFGVADATYYQGDSVQLTARVSEGIEVSYGVPGNQPAFQQMIGALKAAIQGDSLDDAGLLNSALHAGRSGDRQYQHRAHESGFRRQCGRPRNGDPSGLQALRRGRRRRDRERRRSGDHRGPHGRRDGVASELHHRRPHDQSHPCRLLEVAADSPHRQPRRKAP